jgi:uncharacterized membrane protein YbhN (UPF0104 family)
VVVSLAFVALLLFSQGGELPRLRAELAAFGWKLRPGWLAAAVAIGTANLFLMGRIWVGLFRSLGGSVGAGEGVRIWMITNLGRYVPGKVWQLSGLAIYMRDRSRAGAAALTSAGLFQLLALGTGLAVAAVTLGAEFFRGGGALPFLAVVFGLLLVLLLRPSIAEWATRSLSRRFGESVPSQSASSADLWLAAVGLVGAWIANGAGLWCIWRGAGGDSSPGILTMSGVFAAAYAAGYVVLFAPGGLVVREGAMAGLLAATAGVPVSVGAAVALLARLWAVATELLAAGIAWAFRDSLEAPVRASTSTEEIRDRGEG